MTSVGQDLRYALRAITRRPTFAVATIASLAIAIAANTAVFSVVNATLLRDLSGVTRPERLVEISRAVGSETADVTWPMYRHLSTQPALDGLAALALESVSIATRGAPSVRGAAAVTASYFQLLGVGAQLGRVFAADEASFPRVAPVAIISHDVWQRELGGARDVVGRTLSINGSPLEVIGVLPAGFNGHHTGLLLDVFLPMGLAIPGLPDPATLDGTGSSVELLGRLKDGVAPGAAQAALTTTADAFARSTGEASERHPYRLHLANWGPLPSAIRTAVAAFLGVLSFLVFLALSMAGTNLTTILLARASERRRELAVRRALGASERRLARQLVTETLLLFLAAGVAGVVLARWAVSLIQGVEPPVPLPGRLGADFGFDWRVAVYAILVTVGGGLLFTFWPSIGATRFDVISSLREGGASDGRRSIRLRSVLVGVQVAVTSVLLVATLLLGRAFATMRSLEPGWNADGVLITSFDLQLSGKSPEAGREVQRRLRERVMSIPGVEAAALATKTQQGGRSSFGLATAPGAELPAGARGIQANLNRVTAGYLAALQIPLRSGRDIADTDLPGMPNVAVINETMAKRLFPAGEAIGRTFDVLAGKSITFQVIGVAADAEMRSPDQPPIAFYYVPLAQWYNSAVNLNVRTSPQRMAGVATDIARVFEEVDPSIPYTRVRPLAEALEIFLLPQRVAAWVSGLTGVFGLLLAGIGIYGVTAFLVNRRAREVAIRTALGATNGQLLTMLLRQGGRAPLIGLAIGMVIATAFSIGAAKVLTGATAGDPFALLGTPLLVFAITSGAMLVPIRRLLGGSAMARLRED